MSLAYYASPIDFNQNEKLEQKRKESKKTKLNLDVLKRLAQPKESQMQKIHEDANRTIKDENESILADFYEKEMKSDMQKRSLETSENQESKYKKNENISTDYLIGNNLHANEIDRPRVTDYASPPELLSKLNHIIQMFEEQKEIRTNQKNEEVVMYCFLGIFVIYVLDSFVYIGQYKR